MSVSQLVFGKCPYCHTKISKLASKCPNCTSSLVTKKAKKNEPSLLDMDLSLPKEEEEKFGRMMNGIFLGYLAWGLFLYFWPKVTLVSGAVTFVLFPIIGILFTSNSNKK